MFEAIARCTELLGGDIDREYCLKMWDGYTKTSEPDLLYGYTKVRRCPRTGRVGKEGNKERKRGRGRERRPGAQCSHEGNGGLHCGASVRRPGNGARQAADCLVRNDSTGAITTNSVRQASTGRLQPRKKTPHLRGSDLRPGRGGDSQYGAHIFLWLSSAWRRRA